MGRLSLLFAALLMILSMSLVTARFQSRQLFVVSDRLDATARQLGTDWLRLQLERAELARNAHIDKVARDDLKMVSTSPQRTIYIKGGGSEAIAPATQAKAGRRP
ncbi:MAG TPA: cell division protein FtsL [Paralcaligenes sp.]|jgi:cell division protein FtsL